MNESTDTGTNQTNANQTDITIIGAGMVGTAVACGLADAGYQVTIVDRLAPADYIEGAAPHIRVSALSYASERFLQTLGAWHDIMAMRSCPYKQLAVWEKLTLPFSKTPLNSRLNQTLFDADQVGTPHLGHIVENDITQLALHRLMQSKPGIRFVSHCSIKAICHQLDHIQVSLDNEETLSSKLLIGADGAMSRVRELSNIGLNSDQYEQQAMVITIAHDGPQQDITWQAFTSTGPLAYLPLPSVEGQSYGSLVWYNLPENIASLMKLSDSELITRIIKDFPEELPTPTNIIEKGRFPLVKRHAQNYVKPRTVLVGDAAHTINPLAGQGVNLGFQDAETLTTHLRSAQQQGIDPGSLELLRTYEKARRPANSQMMLLMDMFYHTFSNEVAPLKAVRNLGLHFANQAPWAKTKVLKYAMGID